MPTNTNAPTATDPYASYGGSVADNTAPADPYAAYGGSVQSSASSAPLTEADAASGDFANQQASQTQTARDLAQPTHVLLNGKIQPINQSTGAVAGVKRNTVDALTGLYHAMRDPATEQEKAEILQKIREQNAKGDK